MMKIKLKDTDPASSLRNKNFSIEKGQIIEVPDDFVVGSRFDIVERNGEVLIKEDKLTQVDIERMLSDNNPKSIIEFMTKHDVTYNDIDRVHTAELNGRRRKELLRWCKEVPRPVDKGIRFTNESMFMGELKHITEKIGDKSIGIDDKTCRLIVDEFKTQEALIEALKYTEPKLDNTTLDLLRKHFKVHLELAKAPKEPVKRFNAEEYPVQNTGATTTAHFPFLKKR
jgi:hypothetical protein